ncbi:hypothetical protein JXQ31_15565 [candidate division KSB1 bacterium]|nr:hypothetical protein [candidate division KSB1 bacterium]
MKTLKITLLLLFLVSEMVFPQQDLQTGLQKNPGLTLNEPKFYAGINPLALPAAFQVQDDVKRYLPIMTGLEYGFAVSGGYFFNSNHCIESRLALGYVNKLAFTGQLHAGSNYFLFRKLNIRPKNLYIGGFIKFWDYYNRYTKVHFLNLSPYLTLGYRKQIGRLFYDIRLNQTIFVYSWSSLEHTSPGHDWFFSPWPAFIPVLPTFTFTIGWMF